MPNGEVSCEEDFTDPEENEKLLKAQLYAVSNLHFFLPLCPNAWIMYMLDCKKDQEKFFLHQVYLRNHKPTTLYMIITMIAILGFGPCTYAHTVMSNPCEMRNFTLSEIVSAPAGLVNLTEHSTDCSLRKWMLEPHLGSAVLSVLSGFVFAAVGKFVLYVTRRRDGHAHISVSSTFILLLLTLTEMFLPRVVYSGLGPCWEGRSNCGSALLEEDFRTLYDVLGTSDLLVSCLSTALVTFLSSVIVATMHFGLTGAPAGAAIGSLLARFVLFFLNYVIGASSKLITYVDGELLDFQPHRKVFKSDQRQVDTEYIDRMVLKTYDLLLQDKKMKDIAEAVREHGAKKVEYIAKWLLTHQSELAYLQGSCYRLFRVRSSSYTCGEFELAALTMMNIECFLVSYFAEEKNFELETVWNTHFLISETYITNPVKKICRGHRGHPWMILRRPRERVLARVVQNLITHGAYSPMP